MKKEISDSRNNPALWSAACVRLLNSLVVIERGLVLVGLPKLDHLNS